MGIFTQKSKVYRKLLSYLVMGIFVLQQIGWADVTSNTLAPTSGAGEIWKRIESQLELGRIEKDFQDGLLTKAASELQRFSQRFNFMEVSEEDKNHREEVLIRKSNLARDIAVKAIGDHVLVQRIKTEAFGTISAFNERRIAEGRKSEAAGVAELQSAKKYIDDWLDPTNNIPGHIRAGILRGMLEGRDSDLLFAFGPGWRKFGTAGIRNPAVASGDYAIQDLELEEFAQDPHAPILTGPNMINTVTLLQQEAAVTRLFEYLEDRSDDPALDLSEEFKTNIRGKKVTIAYDSRLNGEYFAKLLASAFLRDEIKVDLFDNASGMPGLVYAAERMHSAFGFLISASHSEANFNGFKAVLGHLASQLDAAGKDMIMDRRAEVTYQDMQTDLAEKPIEEFSEIIASKRNNLRWLSTRDKRPGFNYSGAKRLDFYTGREADLGVMSYYEHIERRSPLARLDARARQKINAVRTTLSALYTAFYGVGATPAADLAGFLSEMGYKEIDIVKRQTDHMDGRFPGHYMPDPGVVSGWVVNLVDYLVQEAGEDLSDIKGAIAKLNEKEVGAATDPDIDRAGMMLSLEKGVRGNIKENLILAVERYMDSNNLGEVKKVVLDSIKEELDDKLLLTANDAWAFMAYYQLRMMQEHDLLQKDKLYFIEESHVTTPALERIAEIFNKQGYRVRVIQTYVGFTELAKKSRDLFNIAQLCWHFKDEHARGEVFDLFTRANQLIGDLEKAYEVLQSNVPSGTNVVPEIGGLISSLREVRSESDIRNIEELTLLTNMDILYGVEESNGYGEFGRFDARTGEVVDKHISEKDGSLAAFKFLDIIAYGKSQGKTGYDMYMDMMSSIGHVATDNRFLPHPGLSGNDEKEAEVQAFEKIFAYGIQKALDMGKHVRLFNGKYTVEKVEVYRDYKYDDIYGGFPEEGVRLYLKTQRGSDAIVTLRPSGTGDTIRCYAWIMGEVPKSGTRLGELEGYRQEINGELKELADDFFGNEDLQGKGVKANGYYPKAREELSGLMAALNEAGLQRQEEVFSVVTNEGDWEITDAERTMYDIAGQLAFSGAKGKMVDPALERKNHESVESYLEETAQYPVKIDIDIKGKQFSIPQSALMSWRYSFVQYIASFVTDERELKGSDITLGAHKDDALKREIITAWKRQLSTTQPRELHIDPEDISSAA